jgi:hypothetical protein
MKKRKHFTRHLGKEPKNEQWVKPPKKRPEIIPKAYFEDAGRCDQIPVLKWHWLYGWGYVYCPIAIQDSTYIFYPVADAVRSYKMGYGFIEHRREHPGKPYYILVEKNHVTETADEPPRGMPNWELAYVALNPGVIQSIF